MTGRSTAGACPRGRVRHHRDGHLHLLCRLPNTGDRRDHPRLSAARNRLREPRCAADGHRARLRLGGWSIVRRGHHLTDDRYGLPAFGRVGGMVGPYDGYARNADAHKRVMRKHAAGNDSSAPSAATTLRAALATAVWQDPWPSARETDIGMRRPSVLAPTGCLTGDTLVSTDRGLLGCPNWVTSTATGGRTWTSRCPRTRARGSRRSSSSTARSRPAGSSPRAATASRGRWPTGSRSSTRSPASGYGSGWPTSHPATWCRCSSADRSASP